MSNKTEEKIKFLKAENKMIKSFNKELASEVKELRNQSPERDLQVSDASPDKLEVDPSGKKELLVSADAKEKIQTMQRKFQQEIADLQEHLENCNIDEA